MSVDLSKLEVVDDMALLGLWLDVLKDVGLIKKPGTKAYTKAYWIGFGSRKDVLRAGLIDYRAATNDDDRESALMRIVDSYRADCKDSA